MQTRRLQINKAEEPHGRIRKARKALSRQLCRKEKNLFIQKRLSAENLHEEYKSLFHTYWDEVSVQIEKVVAAGKIRKIFCEHIASAEEDALDVFARVNERAAHLIRKKMEDGGTLLPLEAEEIFGPLLDWRN